jgi:hypothetical protein
LVVPGSPRGGAGATEVFDMVVVLKRIVFSEMTVLFILFPDPADHV